MPLICAEVPQGLPFPHRSAAAHALRSRDGRRSQKASAAIMQNQRRVLPTSSIVLAVEARLQQHIVAIAGDDEIHDLRIDLLACKLFADEDAQVRGHGRIGIVDGLVLADQAAQARTKWRGPGLRAPGLSGFRRAVPPRRARSSQEQQSEACNERFISSLRRSAARLRASARRCGSAGR